jgi:hypothetical protein
MLTEKQMKSLKKGTYTNTQLQKVFSGHCVGKGLKPEFALIAKDNILVKSHIKNRKQRRARA